MRIAILILTGVLMLGGVAIGIYASMEPGTFGNLMGLLEERNLIVFLPLGIIIFTSLIMLGAFYPLISGSIKKSRLKKELKNKGVRTEAKILAVQDTGISINDNPYVQITVETTKGVTATFKMTASRIAVPRPGDSMLVLYDPVNPSVAIPAD